jgi:class 3 adenylate cyclase
MSAVTIHDTADNSGAAPTDAPQVRTLLLTDLVDSTTLVERLGDGPAAALFREHDRLVLELQQRWRGRLIDRSDGLLLLFERPVDALGFALDYNRGLRALDDRPELKPPCRPAQNPWKSKASPSRWLAA